jgi:hypothetical protein
MKARKSEPNNTPSRVRPKLSVVEGNFGCPRKIMVFSPRDTWRRSWEDLCALETADLNRQYRWRYGYRDLRDRLPERTSWPHHLPSGLDDLQASPEYRYRPFRQRTSHYG